MKRKHTFRVVHNPRANGFEYGIQRRRSFLGIKYWTAPPNFGIGLSWTAFQSEPQAWAKLAECLEKRSLSRTICSTKKTVGRKHGTHTR